MRGQLDPCKGAPTAGREDAPPTVTYKRESLLVFSKQSSSSSSSFFSLFHLKALAGSQSDSCDLWEDDQGRVVIVTSLQWPEVPYFLPGFLLLVNMYQKVIAYITQQKVTVFWCFPYGGSFIRHPMVLSVGRRARNFIFPVQLCGFLLTKFVMT